MNLTAIKNVLDANPLVMVGGTNLATVLVALEVNAEIKPVQFEFTYEFGDHWLRHGYPYAERLIGDASKSLPINKELCMEYSRRLYQKRCCDFLNAAYVFYNELNLSFIDSTLEIDESLYYLPLSMIGDYLAEHNSTFSGHAIFGNTNQDFLQETTQGIVDIIEEKFDYAGWEVRDMRQVIHGALLALSLFLEANACGPSYGSRLSGAYIHGALEAMKIPEDEVKMVTSCITGSEEYMVPPSEYLTVKKVPEYNNE